MASRKVPFIDNEYYHILNRGVAKMRIFENFHDYNRFIKTMLYYMVDDLKPKFSTFTPTTMKLNRGQKMINFICYCLMPNHFHFLIQQKREGGITEFMSKLSNSYTKYFNVKNKRNGPILQGEFRAVHIGNHEQLMHLSRYIHLNPLVSYLTRDLNNYKWSSYFEYVNDRNDKICAPEIILGEFQSVDKYKQFVLDQEDYGKQLEALKHESLDFNG